MNDEFKRPLKRGVATQSRQDLNFAGGSEHLPFAWPVFETCTSRIQVQNVTAT